MEPTSPPERNPFTATAPPDPRRNPWLTVDEALCWIAFRGCPEPDDESSGIDQLKAAERELVAAAAAGRIHGKGEEGTRDKPHPGVMPRTIPPDAFAKHDAGLSVLNGGKLGLRHSAPISAILDYAGPYFHHVRFDAAAILAEWPAAAPARSAAAPPPKLSDMPARWTLLEALAWIMFRDPRTVRGASLEMPREATTYWAETRLPGGDAELLPVMGEPGSGRLRLSLEWAYDRAQGTPANGLAPDAAENDLLAKLRSGAIIARGRLATDGTPRTMDPGDWRGLALVERTRGDVAAEPQGTTGQAWREISVARDDVVREWPPNNEDGDAAAAALTAPQPEARPPRSRPRPDFTLSAGRAWYTLRCRTWPKGEPPPSEATDLEDVRAHFAERVPPIPRQTIREIRRELAPPEWRKSGPRKQR
jgi:hypothetical protein